jgi:hypothetical protein
MAYRRLSTSSFDCDISTAPLNLTRAEQYGACDSSQQEYSQLEPGVTKPNRGKVFLGYLRQKGTAIASALGDQLFSSGVGPTNVMHAYTLSIGSAARQNSRGAES